MDRKIKNRKLRETNSSFTKENMSSEDIELKLLKEMEECG